MSTPQTREAISGRLQEIEQERETLERRLASLNSLTEPQRLAVELHEIMCSGNHVDVCGWQYEGGENMWEQSTHKRYLQQATAALRFGVNADTVLKIVKAARGY